MLNLEEIKQNINADIEIVNRMCLEGDYQGIEDFQKRYDALTNEYYEVYDELMSFTTSLEIVSDRLQAIVEDDPDYLRDPEDFFTLLED